MYVSRQLKFRKKLPKLNRIFPVEWISPPFLLDLRFRDWTFDILFVLQIFCIWWEIEQTLLLSSVRKWCNWRHCECWTYIFKVTNFEMWISWKWWKLVKNALRITFIVVDVCHLMGPLQLLYSDFELNFQGHKFESLISWKWWELLQKIHYITCAKVAIRHRMAPL